MQSCHRIRASKLLVVSAMPKPDEAKKLKSPLYCSQWIGKYCWVAGGGGRQSFGLPNR